MFRSDSGRIRTVCSGMQAAAGHTQRTGRATGSTGSRANRRRERADTDAEGDRRRQQTRIPLRDPASRARHEYVPGHRRHPGQRGDPIAAFAFACGCTQILSGTGKDQSGNASFGLGGAFLIPYPNRILGTLSPDGKSVITQWRGHTLALPANFPSKHPGGPVVAIHGLITQAKVEDLQTQTTADGQTVTGVIHAGDFGGHWLSDTDLNFTIALTGDGVETTITAKNVGKEPEPMSIGWHPYFVIPSGHRAQARVHIPATMMAIVNNYGDAFPTGQLKPVKGTEYDYTAPDGVALDDHFLDDNFSHLQRTNGAADVKLIDPESNYGLTVSALSPEIRTVQVYSPKTAFVAVEPQFNYVDPFGKVWKGMDTGMVTLRPGQSVTWKVRLELFTPGH